MSTYSKLTPEERLLRDIFDQNRVERFGRWLMKKGLPNNPESDRFTLLEHIGHMISKVGAWWRRRKY